MFQLTGMVVRYLSLVAVKIHLIYWSPAGSQKVPGDNLGCCGLSTLAPTLTATTWTKYQHFQAQGRPLPFQKLQAPHLPSPVFSKGWVFLSFPSLIHLAKCLTQWKRWWIRRFREYENKASKKGTQKQNNDYVVSQTLLADHTNFHMDPNLSLIVPGTLSPWCLTASNCRVSFISDGPCSEDARGLLSVTWISTLDAYILPCGRNENRKRCRL